MVNSVRVLRERSYRVMFEYHNVDVIKNHKLKPYGEEKTFWRGTDQDFDTSDVAQAHGWHFATEKFANYPPTGKFKVVRTDSTEIIEHFETEYIRMEYINET